MEGSLTVLSFKVPRQVQYDVCKKTIKEKIGLSLKINVPCVAGQAIQVQVELLLLTRSNAVHLPPPSMHSDVMLKSARVCKIKSHDAGCDKWIPGWR